MFVRTERLLLRPGWLEDAPALAQALGERSIVCNLARVPWPYHVEDAEAFLAAERRPDEPSFLVFRRTHGSPQLIGSAGLGRNPDGAVELGYWIARPHWGLGYATEAARAVVDVARSLRLRRLTASHFIDNPASGRVLHKLGFRPSGIIAPRYSLGRGREAPCRLFELKLARCPAEGSQVAEPADIRCEMIAA
jgi:RimJ/RimL family protein N-acetyltransferase